MREAIRQFQAQFAYEPIIQNAQNLRRSDKFIVCGMGGSHLAAGLLKIYNPKLDLLVHRDYGLPEVPDYFINNSMIIFSSYSGNTEEVIDAFNVALERKSNMAVLSTGGALLTLAQSNNIPFVQMPSIGLQPRMALGFTIKGIVKLAGLSEAFNELSSLSRILEPLAFENKGKELAKSLAGYVPVIYSSAKNLSIAYNWKIKLNETGKVPAFYNVLPELNHNEMTSFDTPFLSGAVGPDHQMRKMRESLNAPFAFIFLKDEYDDPRIQKRMTILERLYKKRNMPVTILGLAGATIFEKVFSSLVMADWTAYYTAELYGIEAEQVPLVEEFKKMISSEKFE